MLNDYLSIINSPYIEKFKKIYFTDDVQLYHRLIATAARQKGILTFKFDHGNNFYLKKNKLNKFFLSNYDFNICENQNSFKVLNQIYKKNKIFLKNSNVKFQNIPFKKKFKKKFNIKNKTVMLIGFPMTTYRYLGSEDLFWHNEFLLELQILKSLKKNGYKILYKIHPSVLGWEHILKNFVDEIVYTNFESCWKKADLFIFTNIGSTTFTYALSTNIPIILFENKKNENWNTCVYRYIKKRCALICYDKDKNLKDFSEKSFLQKISKTKPVSNNLVLNDKIIF